MHAAEHDLIVLIQDFDPVPHDASIRLARRRACLNTGEPLLPEQVDRGGGEALTERGDRRSGMQDEAEMEAVAQP